MAIFGPKPWIDPFEKTSIFPLFRLLVFIAWKGVFSTPEYCKRHFSGVYWLKKNWKNGHFWTKPMGKPPWKIVNFSTFWTSCFYSLERRFLALEYWKRHFSGLWVLKKKVGKISIFGPKPWVNPFGKMSIFPLFELHVLIA